HFNLEEALELIKELKPEKAYLTHISHQLGKHSDVEKELPPNVFLAYDGFEIEMS
ncbi:MAG TPA: MBL fold metallo-hydrolase, partial [Bacteroidia bacterium]|nr:MBL fold metallo-hydrolase [Bacteroidia bacterium]